MLRFQSLKLCFNLRVWSWALCTFKGTLGQSALPWTEQRHAEAIGLLRELNPGPLAPEARIMPLDQAANWLCTRSNKVCFHWPVPGWALQGRELVGWAGGNALLAAGGGRPLPSPFPSPNCKVAAFPRGGPKQLLCNDKDFVKSFTSLERA